MNGLFLADDALVKQLAHLQELLGLGLGEAAHRNPGPRSDDLGDVIGGNAQNAVARGLAVAPFLLEIGLFETQLLFAIAYRGSFIELLVLDDRFFFGDQLAQLRVGLANRRRRQRCLQANAGAGLVDKIDGLVGEKAIGDIPVAQPGGARQCLVRNLHLVVRFVAIAQAFENLDRLLDRRLANHHRLEPALECGIFLDVFAKLVERRCADALQLASCEGGLNDVAGVDRTFGSTGPNQRMELIDEEDDLAGGAADLVHHALHPLFKLAAVLRARHESRQIERYDAPVAQGFGDVAFDHALRETLGDCRLADARFADKGRIIFGAPREYLDDALDFAVAPDHRVELVVARELREVAPIGIQRRRLTLSFGRCRLTLGSEQRRRLHADLRGIDAEIGQHAGGHAFAFADQAKEQVLGSDVVVVKLTRFFKGELDHALGARREDHLLLHGLAAASDDRFDLLTDFREIDAQRFEDFRGQALAFGDNAKQNVLGSDIVVSETLRFFLSEHDAAPRSLGEGLPHRHRSGSSFPPLMTLAAPEQFRGPSPPARLGWPLDFVKQRFGISAE